MTSMDKGFIVLKWPVPGDVAVADDESCFTVNVAG